MNTVFALPLVLLTFVSTHTRCLLRGREVWVCPGFGVGVSRMWCGLPTPYLPVAGATEEEAYAALQSQQWDTAKAVHYLKVESLFRLGLTSREKCKEELSNVSWNIQQAASNLIDKCHIGVDV
ncbi:TNK2 [Bugula neritina]|uniref:TNK2 n=1 Tax=Bugula neritina TaxID=10212 RepID=A0A7J7K694_BUGNE|nr:TNK2 [Bugula neritina]